VQNGVQAGEAARISTVDNTFVGDTVKYHTQLSNKSVSLNPSWVTLRSCFV